MRILLAITGSVAAYKAPIVARALLAKKAHVTPILTRAAHHFLGPATLSGLTAERVYTDMWDPHFAGEMHIELAKTHDVLAIVPATADTLSRLARGRASDLLSALALSFDGPILIAPAMHPRMWAHPATQRNVRTLLADGRVTFVGPIDGPVASGESGVGRLEEPEVIASRILALGDSSADLRGKTILVTAGPTLEDLDPVRFIGNRSTGKMGFAIARAAARRGAHVLLVAGPTDLAVPTKFASKGSITRHDVRSAVEMHAAVLKLAGKKLGKVDAIIKSAAVSDYRPNVVSADKTKKGKGPLTIELVRTPDILSELGAVRARAKNAAPLLVGFAVETGSDEQILGYANDKLERKQVDLIVANAAKDSFGKESNRAAFVTREEAPVAKTAKSAKRRSKEKTPSESAFFEGSKADLAERILDFVSRHIAKRK